LPIRITLFTLPAMVETSRLPFPPARLLPAGRGASPF
jgi:hypothetical protein